MSASARVGANATANRRLQSTQRRRTLSAADPAGGGAPAHARTARRTGSATIGTHAHLWLAPVARQAIAYDTAANGPVARSSARRRLTGAPAAELVRPCVHCHCNPHSMPTPSQVRAARLHVRPHAVQLQARMQLRVGRRARHILSIGSSIADRKGRRKKVGVLQPGAYVMNVWITMACRSVFGGFVRWCAPRSCAQGAVARSKSCFLRDSMSSSDPFGDSAKARLCKNTVRADIYAHQRLYTCCYSDSPTRACHPQFGRRNKALPGAAPKIPSPVPSPGSERPRPVVSTMSVRKPIAPSEPTHSPSADYKQLRCGPPTLRLSKAQEPA